MKRAWVVVVAVGIAGGAMFWWQSSIARDLDEDKQRLQEKLAALQIVNQDLRDNLHDTRSALATMRRNLQTLLKRTTSARPADLADGRHMAYLTSLSTEGAVIDVVQWLRGDAADQAAAERGDIEPGEHVPNDYYIVNDNPMLRTLAFAEEVEVLLFSLETGVLETERSTLQHLLGLFAEPRPGEEHVVSSPYWVTVADGLIVGLEEQYLP
jgi:hypothetical protein